MWLVRLIITILPTSLVADMKFAHKSGCLAAKRIVELRQTECPKQHKAIEMIPCEESKGSFDDTIKLSRECAKLYEAAKKATKPIKK